MRTLLATLLSLVAGLCNAATLKINKPEGVAIYTTTATVIAGNLYSGLLATMVLDFNDRIFYSGSDEQPGQWNYYIGVFPSGNLFAQGGPCRAIQYVPAAYLELSC